MANSRTVLGAQGRLVTLLLVVCLRGGERGTCLDPPLFASPLEELRT